MAMTNALNSGTDELFNPFMSPLIVKNIVSSPIFLPNLYVKISRSNISSSSGQFIWFIIPDRVIEKPKFPNTPRDQLKLISAFFNFPKAKLGDIFGVTRQSIYDWFDNKNISSENYQKIKRLADVVFEVDPEPSQQVFHIYANEVLEGYEKSLFEYLIDDDFDKNKIVELSKTIYGMSKDRWQRIDSTPKAKYVSGVLSIE